MAVIVALYFSRESQRVKLVGFCGIRVLAIEGVPKKRLFFMSVTNVGHRKVTINNLGLSVGGIKKRYAIIIPFEEGDLVNKIPVTIEDGEEATWSIPLGENQERVKNLVGEFAKTKRDIETLRFIVYTTHGVKKLIKPEKSLVEEIISAVNNKKI